ncbi:DUF2059 domain-containing protein [Aquincola sp. S2]|uniref:DUF2059 domain-containing protein n=1 Tax=Pseudaquabacterium terrae TaxID=2732868 RepID=A0ABX2EH41_9BURK|nr:DUF2059 domain-containing protein [Aquabacterium terrae]
MATAALAAATGLCAAQGTPVSPAKKELVQKILQLQRPGLENLGNTLAGQMSNQVLQMAGQAVMRVAPDKREAVGKEVQGEVRKFYDEAAPLLREQTLKQAPATIGSALEEKFSEDELKTLIAWLESPVNRKFQQLAAEMNQGLTQKVMGETRPLLEPKLKSLEQAVAKRLSDAGVPVTAKSASNAAPKASAPKK